MARLREVVVRLTGQVDTGVVEVERVKREVAWLTQNVTGTSNDKKLGMLLARLNENV